MVAILIAGASFLVAAGSLALSVIAYRSARQRELWWAVVDDDSAEEGVPISFRLYEHRYFGKSKPRKRLHPYATVIRGYVLSGESRIDRERMSQRDAIKEVRRRLDRGELDPEVPHEVHPPRITMVPLKVIRYGVHRSNM